MESIHIQGGQLSKLILPPEKKPMLKGKILLPLEANFLNADSISKRLDEQKSKQEVTKIASLVKNGTKFYQVYPNPLNLTLVLLNKLRSHTHF